MIKKSLESWQTAFYSTIKNYLQRGMFIGKDQNMMATACLETDLCLLVKGEIWNWFLLQSWFKGEIRRDYNRLNLTKYPT